MKIGYARVSSLEQARDSSALTQQQERLRHAGCQVLYTDVQSGTRDDRPQLKLALAALKPDDTLVATRLDRLTRNPAFNEQLLNRFSAPGAPGLHLLDDGLDFTTVAGRLTARLLSAVAAGEVERLSERTAHGRSYRQSKGGHGAKPPWGFLRAPDRLGLVVDPELESIARGTVNSFLQSKSLRATAAWLLAEHGIAKSKNSLRRWLQNPALAGGIGRTAGTVHTRPDGTRYRRPPEPGVYDSIEWDRHQGLIDRGQWAEIQRGFQISKERGGGAHRAAVERTWISGRFCCGGCGHKMHRHWQRIRCTAAQCHLRHGPGSIHVDIANASLRRAVEWMARHLAEELAPMAAAMQNQQAAEPDELRKIREEVRVLKLTGVSGLEAVIAQKESQIAAMEVAVHGDLTSTAAALDRLLPLLRQAWSLTDEELAQLADDAELEASVDRGWVQSVRSKRFGCTWSFTRENRREEFRLDPGILGSPEERRARLDLEEGQAVWSTPRWWAAVEVEEMRQALEKI